MPVATVADAAEAVRASRSRRSLPSPLPRASVADLDEPAADASPGRGRRPGRGPRRRPRTGRRASGARDRPCRWARHAADRAARIGQDAARADDPGAAAGPRRPGGTVGDPRRVGGVEPARSRELVRRPPVRRPHHTISYAGMVGGGPRLSPGEVTLADQGTLFCDELAEFGRDVLEALRQPLEDGSVAVVRVGRAEVFPARFTFVAAMNPCPCGQLGAADRACTCPPGVPERYLRRVSGPLRDRIDLWVSVDRVPPAALIGPVEPEASAPVAARIAEARARQRARSGDVPKRARRPTARCARSCRPGRRRPRVGRSPWPTARGCRVAGRSGCSGSHGRSRTWAGRRSSDRAPSRRGGALSGAGGPHGAPGGRLMLGRRQGGRVAAVGAADRRGGGRRTGGHARRRDRRLRHADADDASATHGSSSTPSRASGPCRSRG